MSDVTQIPDNAIKAEIADWAKCVWGKAYYDVIYGGRGGGRSYNVAAALLIRGMQEPLKVLCAREFQNSISESVHSQLEIIIDDLGLRHFYDVQNKAIYGANGTEFKYCGLATNPESVKSFAGVDVCWVEEADTVREKSWELLIPTIMRKRGAKIIITFNPGLETSYTYQRFVVKPPKNSTVTKAIYLDNPFCPQELVAAAEEMRLRDYAAYKHYWLGEPLSAAAGAVYDKEVTDILDDGRLLPMKPIFTYPTVISADLGYADSTVLWFIQRHGSEHHIVDCIEHHGERWPYYVELLLKSPYNISGVILPPDANHKRVDGAELTPLEQTRAAGFPIIDINVGSVNEGIESTRLMLASSYWNKNSPGVVAGFESIRRYRWKVSREGAVTRKAHHDEFSHHADGLRYYSIAPLGFAMRNVVSGARRVIRKLIDRVPS